MALDVWLMESDPKPTAHQAETLLQSWFAHCFEKDRFRQQQKVNKECNQRNKKTQPSPKKLHIKYIQIKQIRTSYNDTLSRGISKLIHQFVQQP